MDWRARTRQLCAGFALEEPGMAAAYVILPLAAIPRIWTAWADQGVFWPDEIYQTIEQGHRLAFGYGMVPWEFRDGARSWVFPGILAGVLKLARLLGERTGPDLVHTAKAFMALLALWGVFATMKLARLLGTSPVPGRPRRKPLDPARETSGRYAALLAGTMAALFPAGIVYGTRCMTEMVSVPFVITAAWLAIAGGRWREIVAGALAAIAIYFRFQNGLFAVGLLVMLAASRRWKDGLFFGLAAFVIGVAGGYLDKLTWGEWFHSFLVYVKFNVIEGKASGWGVADFGYYARTVWTSTGWPLALIGVGLLLAFPRAVVLWLTAALYLGAHNAVPHKEYRFLMPVMPVLVALAAGGLGWLLERIARRFPEGRAGRAFRWLPAGMAIAIGVSFVHTTWNITFEEMGQAVGSRDGAWPPWHHESGPNLCFWEAGQHNDLCGIIMVGTPLISTGGYTYLHKNVPILTGMSGMEMGAANFAALPSAYGAPAGWWKIADFPGRNASQASYTLYRRAGGCEKAYWFQPMFP